MQDNLSTSSFKKYSLFLLKVLLFLITLFPTIIFIGNTYSKASTENIINGFNKQRFEDFYKLPKNSLDMVFLGSSHSYCTFNPEIFDETLNTSSFQMGMPLQHPDSTYYTLKEVLNYQKPKIVVMEVYWDLLKNDFEFNQVKTLFQVLKNPSLKQEYIIKDFPLSEKLKYSINILKYQNDYFAYKGNEISQKIKNKFNLKDKVIEKQKGTEKYLSKGYVYCDYNMLDSEYNKTNQFKNLDGKNFVLSKVQKEFLEKIISLCKDNNIKLIFVTAPIANVSIDYIKNYDLIHNQIQQFANQYNIPYIDYNIINKNENLLTNQNFRDDAHLNDSGVKIISNHFLNILKEMNILQ